LDQKFGKGIMAGIAAGLIKNIPNAILHIFFPSLNKIAFWDYAGTIALGRLPKGPLEIFYALFLETLFSTFLALIFIHSRFLNQSDHFKWKGIFYGAWIWFMVRAAVLGFDIKVLLNENLGNSVTNLLLSMLYGCLLVCAIKALDKKRVGSNQ
jgi:hypothetical protein